MVSKFFLHIEDSSLFSVVFEQTNLFKRLGCLSIVNNASFVLDQITDVDALSRYDDVFRFYVELVLIIVKKKSVFISFPTVKT